MNKMSAEPYVPELGIKYPSKPNDRMLSFDILRDVKVDENYPFLDKSFKFRFMRGLIYLVVFTAVAFVSPLRYGFKIEGRRVLRKYRNLLKDGAMTVSNHVHRWDFLFVLLAVRYRKMFFPVWKKQLNGPDFNFIRLAGGIPIPDSIQTFKYFNSAFDEIHAQKTWIHVFPESSRFDYFQPIRPFKKGVFTMAQRYNLPILPLAISYRKPRFPWSLRRQKIPLITIRIGEPITPDTRLSRKEAVFKLRKETHEAVVRLAGITKNPYPSAAN